MRVDNKISKIFMMIIKFIGGIFSAIGVIAISTIIALNMTFVYKLMIEKYDLVKATGVSLENLMINYKGLIKYLENPFIDKLYFQDFAMSTYGEIHFYEVKRIFIMLIFIAVIFILFILIGLLLGIMRNKKNYIKEIIKNLNTSANILIGFFILLVGAYVIDFSKAFTIFHKIFFRNDYWIFDARIDPIINALPEELFMVYGGIILGIIILFILIMKIVRKKYIKA